MPDKHLRHHAVTGGLKIAIVYAVISFLWIVGSDSLLAAIVTDKTLFTRLSIIKGWVFVAITATILWLMVSRFGLMVGRREALWRALVENMPMLVWFKNPEGRYIACNHEFAQRKGKTEQDILGKTDFDLSSADDAGIDQIRDLETITRRQPTSYEQAFINTQSGKKLHLEIIKAPLHDESGELLGVLSIAHDISQQRATELALQETLRYNHLLFTDSRIPLIVMDTEILEYVDCNDAAVKIYGYSRREDVVGLNPLVVSAPIQYNGQASSELAPQMIALCLEKGEHQFEWLHQRRDGTQWDAKVHLMKFTHNGRTLVQFSLEDITALKATQAQLSYLAHHDALTHLPNRTLLLDRLKHTIKWASREQCQLGIMFLDLDRFKQINDTLGHDVGDQLLIDVADRMRNQVRSSDTVARMGGDEFVVLLETDVSPHSVEEVGRKLMDKLAQPFFIKGKEVLISASIGISLYPHDANTAEHLLECADMAMYRSKAAGRNQLFFYDESMSRRMRLRSEIEVALFGALDRAELQLHFQPQIELQTGKLAGIEALLRWQHPELGLLRPEQFLQVAEEIGLINSIGEWVLEEACHTLHQWQEQGLPIPFISINLSAKQLIRQNLVDTVASALTRHHLAPNQVELELTEAMLLDAGHNSKVLDGLRQIGVGLSIDDFGSGYSSLSDLQQWNVKRLKIAPRFINAGNESEKAAHIARTIVAIGNNLRLQVVAEGVETADQREKLLQIGCDAAQGYLIAQPMNRQSLEQWLADNIPEYSQTGTNAPT